MPVVAAIKLNDLRPSSKPPRQPHCRHGGFSPGIDHTHFFDTGACDDHFRQFQFRLGRGTEGKP